MQRTTLSCVIVVVLVALSGCNAFGAESTPTEMSGVSPAPVPTDSPTPTPGPADIPGLTDQGIENISTLVSAHSAIFENTSFTAHRNTTVRYTNGTVAFQERQIARVNETHEEFSMETHRDWGKTLLRATSSDYPTPSLVALWSNSTLIALETEPDTNTGPSIRRINNSPTGDLVRALYDSARRSSTGVGSEYFLQALSGSETRITGRTVQNDTVLYRVQLSSSFIRTAPTTGGLVPLAPRPVVEASGNVTVHALVDSRGMIHRSTVSYEARVGPNRTPVNTTYTTRFSDIGSTRVERPSWFKNGINQSSTAGG